MIGIVGGAAIWFLQSKEPTLVVFIPLIVIWLIDIIYSRIVHFAVKRQIDRFLR
jgi:hypothetical protein